MKKIITILFLVFSLAFIIGCKNNDFPESDYKYNEYKGGSRRLNLSLFYKINSYEELDRLSKPHGINLKTYDENYFIDNALILFTISEGSGSFTHRLSIKIVDDTLDVYYKRDELPKNAGYTCDMAYWLVAVEVSHQELESINKFKIGERYLNSYDNYKTVLPETMDDDCFVFIESSLFKCDSRYNIASYRDGDKEINVSLTEEDFNNIYQILRNANIDKYCGEILLNEDGYIGRFYVSVNSYDVSINGYNNPTFVWFDGMELYRALEEIRSTYFKASE